MAAKEKRELNIVVICDECADTGRGKPTLQEPDGIECDCKNNKTKH